MTDPKDIAIRELSRQIAHLLGSETRDYEQREVIAELKREREELLAENERLRRIVPEFGARFGMRNDESMTPAQAYNLLVQIAAELAVPEPFI